MKIEPPLANEAAGGVDFEPAEVLHDAAARVLVEELLEAAAAHEVGAAYVHEREALADALLEIGPDAQEGVVRRRLSVSGRGVASMRRAMRTSSSSSAAAASVLGAEGRALAPLEPRGRGVVLARREGRGALADDAREQGALRLADLSDAAAEALHLPAGAVEADDDEVRRDAPGGEGVEFARRVENQPALPELYAPLPRRDAQLAPVDVQYLPEVVRLAGKGVAAGIFEIVDGV